MAKAFKPTRGLNAFALQYVNSQCQHDSLLVKLAAKLHLFTESAKSMTDYFDSGVSLSALSERESLRQNMTPGGVIKQKEGYKAFLYNWLIASYFCGHVGFKQVGRNC